MNRSIPPGNERTRAHGYPQAHVLGAYGASYYALLEALTPTLDGHTYQIMAVGEYQDLLFKNIPLGMQVYWQEILYRAHWSAASSLIRSHRWLSGVIDAHAKSNLMTFAAASRGFIESAADTNDALNHAPTAFADHHRLIRRSLAGLQKAIIQSGELERHLLEFTHARRPAFTGPTPNMIRSKNTQEYLATFLREDPGIALFYSQLCDITHPGASSVTAFAEANAEGRIVLMPSVEKREIAALRLAFEASLRVAMTLGVGVPILVLKVLNTFAFDPVRTPTVDQVVLDGMPAWEKIRARLSGQHVRKGLLHPSAQPLFIWGPAEHT